MVSVYDVREIAQQQHNQRQKRLLELFQFMRLMYKLRYVKFSSRIFAAV